MLRHEFHPGKLVLGLFLLMTALAYAGDAGGLWDTPWFVAFPLMLAGLLLGGAAAAVSYGIRGKPTARRANPVADRTSSHTGASPADSVADSTADRIPDDRPVDDSRDA